MKKIYFILLSIVAAFLSFQSIVTAQVINVDPDANVLAKLASYEKSSAPHPEGIAYKKVVSEPNTSGVYNIFLEAFVTGSKISTRKSIPYDIVLVLDVSNSMGTTVESYSYSAKGTATTERSYNDANGLYIEYPVGSEKYYQVQQRREGRGKWNNPYRYYLRFSVSGTWYWLSADGIGTEQPSAAESNTETIWTGQLYDRTTVSSMTRLEALKIAVKAFLQTIHDDAVKDPNNILDNKVSIVKFSGQYVGGTAETAMTPGNTQGGTNRPSTEVFKGWTSMADASVVATLQNDVENINTGVGTAIDYGMFLAEKLLGTSTPSTAESPRGKTVVVFTDGEPSHYNWDGNSAEDVADDAIDTANDIKSILAYTTTVDGVATNVYAKVFTVGMLGGDPEPGSTVEAVLERSSSNYKDATSRTTGEEVSNAYCFLADDAESLKNIFESIGASQGGASYELDEQSTATVDVISKSFMLPKNANVNSIKVWTVECVGEYTSGTNIGLLKFSDTWDEGRAQGLEVTLSEDRTEVTVTNFDYSANWCGSETSASGLKTYRGKKVVLGIPIQMATDAVGGKDMATNEEGSGIIVNGENILPFNVPQVSLPINLWVRKEGLEEGESARFKIQRAVVPDTWPEEGSANYPKDSTDPLYNTLKWDDVSSIFVTRHKNQAKTGDNAPTVKTIGLASVDKDDNAYIYRIVEDSNWSWSYTPGTTKIFTSDQLVTNPFVFSNTKKAKIEVDVRHAESKATNTFKNGDFIVDGKVVKKVNATHVGYDDSKSNGRTVITVETETAGEGSGTTNPE